MPNSEKFVRSRRLNKPRDMTEHPMGAFVGEIREAAARALSGPDGEPVHLMSYGEEVVEALSEFIDAKISYANAYRSVGGEWANTDPVNKAADVLTKLLDRKVKVRA